MKFFFTKNGLPGSVAIRWGLGEDCSHMAIGFFDCVFESRMEEGARGSSYADFLRRNTIVHQLSTKNEDREWEMAVYNSVLKNCDGKRYDKGAIAFWAVAALGKKLFGLPQPEKNPWGKRGEHYCVEIIRGSEGLLDKKLGTDFGKRDVEMISPYQAFQILRKSPALW